MSNLLAGTVEAQVWVQSAITRHGGGIYGQLVPGVIWTDARAADGSLLVEAHPASLLNALTRDPIPLLRDHDPGRPVGDVLEAASFVGPQGERFVVALLGYYNRDLVQTFADVGLGEISAPDASTLPELDNDLYIQVASDPRDVPESWIDQIASTAPVPVARTPLSHNAGETLIELVRIGLPFAILVWNPLVKGFATEAGKALYSGLHAWLKRVVASASERKAPCICIESRQNGCQVSFLIRGSDVALNYAAHEGLSQGAAQAARIISIFAQRGTPASKLVYEFDAKAHKWYPSRRYWGQVDFSPQGAISCSYRRSVLSVDSFFGSSNYLFATANSAAGFGLPKSLGDSHLNGGRHVR
ncbi:MULTISPECIES: hypothetical protein [unclassified Xanthomonas]|uniref:hypothetical protein n=1 Tax=Xanthomonas sp. LMG 9002 TaxID=1591158 RepID=UPI0013712715|nr:hypothetical protein [Xanthomonas sp. LMG 9002]